jgi:ketosteroid isomerase-like protein
MSKDADHIMNLYSADAVSMSSEKPTLTGIKAIRESIETMLSDTTLLFNTYKYSIDVVEISSSGDLAYVRGNDEITMKTKDGTVQDKGRFIDIWKKFDGEWKIITMISNRGK